MSGLFAGQWSLDNEHGYGTFSVTEGSVREEYEGEWALGVRSGSGVATWHLLQQVDNGNGNGNGKEEYAGNWEGGKKHGSGVYTWDDGAT